MADLNIAWLSPDLHSFNIGRTETQMRDALSAGSIGALLCWIYAAVWVIWSADPPAVLAAIVAPPPVGVKYIPAMLAGFCLFCAAPFARTQERKFRIGFAVGVLALIAPGIALAWPGNITLAQGVVWLLAPLGIAAWVLSGTARLG